MKLWALTQKKKTNSELTKKVFNEDLQICAEYHSPALFNKNELPSQTVSCFLVKR